MKVLITGATGLVGRQLIPLLLNAGYQVNTLGRSTTALPGTTAFVWKPEQHEIDLQALHQVQAVVHLAGSNIAEGRWTPQRKTEILESRTQPTLLLAEHIAQLAQPPHIFISASAIGYYGQRTTSTIFTETDKAAPDFLGQTCLKWETAVGTIEALGLRTVKFRIGVVLSPQGGALAKLLPPFRLGVGAALGTGKQPMPWVHIADLAKAILHALDKKSMHGTYNIAAPDQVTNRVFSKAVADTLHRPFILPNVPAFALRLALGEMADIILEGNRVSIDRLLATEFQFQYPQLKDALTDLIATT